MTWTQVIILSVVAVFIMVMWIVNACAEQDRDRDVEKRLRELERKSK